MIKKVKYFNLIKNILILLNYIVGLVTLRYNNTENPSDFTINWGSVLERNENYQYEAVAESKMLIRFYDARKIDASELNSICYFDNNNALVDYIEIDNFHRNQDSYNYIVKKSVNYHISVTAETMKDNTYLAYVPTYVYIKIGGYSVTLIGKKYFLFLKIINLIYKKISYFLLSKTSFACIPYNSIVIYYVFDISKISLDKEAIGL